MDGRAWAGCVRLTVVILMCCTKLFKIYNFTETQLFIVGNYAYSKIYVLPPVILMYGLMAVMPNIPL